MSSVQKLYWHPSCNKLHCGLLDGNPLCLCLSLGPRNPNLSCMCIYIYITFLLLRKLIQIRELNTLVSPIMTSILNFLKGTTHIFSWLFYKCIAGPVQIGIDMWMRSFNLSCLLAFFNQLPLLLTQAWAWSKYCLNEIVNKMYLGYWWRRY